MLTGPPLDMIPLSLTRSGPGGCEQSALLPRALAGRWCELRVAGLPPQPLRIALMFYEDEESPGSPLIVAPDGKGTAQAIAYVPAGARRLRLELFGTDALSGMQVSARPIRRGHAAWKLFARSPAPVARAALGGFAGWGRRVRSAMAQTLDETGATASYEFWRRLFDLWPPTIDGFVDAEATEFSFLVVCRDGEATAAAAATLASLNAQIKPASFRVVTPGTRLPDALAPYVGVMQAGEVLPPHATALAAAWLAREEAPPALYGDEDRLDPGGERHSPLFKPEPNRALMLSGTLTRGLWLFRREPFLAYAPERASSAEALRLELWLRLWEAGDGAATRRMPFLLASRRNDAEEAAPEELAAVVQAHFDRIGQSGRIGVSERFPLHVRPVLSGSTERRVTLIVPTALKAAHVSRCLRAVLEVTNHPALDMLLVVSQSTPLSEAQQNVLAAIGTHSRLRVTSVATDRFNYALANNEAVRQTDAEFVCLLNDDVAPTAPDWLDAMLGWFSDPEVAAVGARLLYPNGQVQHGGIIMGIGGLADHAHRFLKRDDPGYGSRAVLSQELSGVTGACLLVRRAAYEQVGGMDEDYPIAFNDVDFCLRLREAGHRIIYCADAELTHYESLSLGHHFSGDRAALERVEVRRMRRRWSEAVASDPFHNPNLSLMRGREWQPAFPSRAQRTRYLGPPESRASVVGRESAGEVGEVPNLLEP